ncbi:MAG: hypothetical protein L0Y56_17630, partial [Nitrospira sp.]|nr:hypothetical protein [Nitrospira sp.]
GAHTQDQHLVVVFTKGDEMIAHFTDPWEELQTYLLEGVVDGLVHPQEYIEYLSHVSTQLREFTELELEAYEFLNIAEAHFKSIEFSIISALGAKPSEGRLLTEIDPRRILDPLFWMMEKSEQSLRWPWWRLRLPNWRLFRWKRSYK